MLVRDLTSGKIVGLDRRVTVGSAASPDVLFAIPEEHPAWCVVPRANRYVLTVLDPRAKVRLNGQPVDGQKTLKVGDEITVGERSFRVEAEKVLAKDDAAARVGVVGDEAEALQRAADRKANSETRAFMEAGDGEVVAIDMSEASKPQDAAVQELIDDVVEAWGQDDKPIWAGGGKATADKDKPKPKSEVRRRPTPKAGFKRGDGPLDVGQSIKDQVKRVDIEALARSKKQHVKLLRMDVIEGLVQAAVQDTAERMGTELNEDARNKMLRETVEEFQARLASFTAEKAGLEAQKLNMQRELDRAQRMLEEERKKTVKADQFTVSEAGVADLEKQFERMVKGAAKGGKLGRELEAQLQQMVQGLLDAEREKIAEQARQAQSSAIAVLEKKVARLAGGMEEAEKERDQAVRRAKQLEAAGGGGLVTSMQVGIADDDEDKARKLELMKNIFEENQALRGHLKNVGKKMHTRMLRAKEIKAEEAKRAAVVAHHELADAVFQEAHATMPEAPREAPAEPSVTPLRGTEAMFDPDDLNWKPGDKIVSAEAELAGDEERNVKVMKSYKKFEPPPLQRKPEPPKPAEPAGEGDRA